jgi:hypothetical protein
MAAWIDLIPEKTGCFKMSIEFTVIELHQDG